MNKYLLGDMQEQRILGLNKPDLFYRALAIQCSLANTSRSAILAEARLHAASSIFFVGATIYLIRDIATVEDYSIPSQGATLGIILAYPELLFPIILGVLSSVCITKTFCIYPKIWHDGPLALLDAVDDHTEAAEHENITCKNKSSKEALGYARIVAPAIIELLISIQRQSYWLCWSRALAFALGLSTALVFLNLISFR